MFLNNSDSMENKSLLSNPAPARVSAAYGGREVFIFYFASRSTLCISTSR